MAFQSREDYKAWKAGRTTVPTSAPAPSAPQPPGTISSPGDVELRLSPLYAILFLGAGAVFTFLGLTRLGKAGPTFYSLCLAGGLIAIFVGIVMLQRRKVIVRMTSTALHLQGAVVPWKDIRSVEIVGFRRRWVGIYLLTPRTDLDAIALKARAAMKAMRYAGADFDYSILETDLPRSGEWFVEACTKRATAAREP